MRSTVLVASLCLATATRDHSKHDSDELRLAQEMVDAETRVRADPTPAPVTPLTCADLTNITVGGNDWTDVVKTVCTHWPSTFGTFPAASVVGVQNTLSILMEENGMWAQLLAKFGEANIDYCLRVDASREIITPTSLLQNGETTFCAQTLNEDVLAEYPEVIIGDENSSSDASPLLSGYWATLAADSDSSTCVYSRRDLRAMTGDTISIASSPSGCQMVHSGVCYGNCPKGFRPTFLLGWFRPVCTSVCAATNHPVTCGVGCANSKTACLKVIMNQVKEVAIAAAKVAAFFSTGTTGTVIVQVVEQVVKIAEFGFNVLSKVLQIAEVAYETFSREEAQLSTLVAIYEIVKTTIGEVQEDIVAFLGVVQTSIPLLTGLIDAQFGWIDIDLEWIATTLMQYGGSILEGAFKVVRAFAYGKCEIADDVVAFTVEDVGDERLVGPWTQDGSRNGKPRYRCLVEAHRPLTVIEWDSRAKTWGIWYKDTTYGRGWWFGWVGFGWRELYDSSSQSASFPTTGWRRLEGSLPLPYMVSATNGGVDQ